MTTETIANTRAAARDHPLERLREEVADDLDRDEDGVPPDQDLEDLEQLLARYFAERPEGEVFLRALDILADGEAEHVWAACPRCGIRQVLSAEISPRLVVEASAELSLRARSKARSHVCGQLPLRVGPESEGQASFDLEDIIGEEHEAEGQEVGEGIEVPADGTMAELVVEACPFPGCRLEADHRGDHEVPGPDEP